MFIRYSFAVVWTIVLSAFSYGKLIYDYIRIDGIGFENKLIDMHSSLSMLVANMGIIFMLYLDRYITYLLDKRRNPNIQIELKSILLYINMPIAAIMTFLAIKIKAGEVILPEWLKLSYLFAIFVVLLIVYKAESMRIDSSYYASDEFSLESKIV
jgi:hypothetical protein